MDEREVAKTTQQAIEGDRNASLAMWRAVAEGRMDAEVQLWLQHVAVQMLEADNTVDARRRPNEIMRAAGLAGSPDRYRGLRDEAKILQELGHTKAQIIEELERKGLLDSDTMDARSFLDRELRKG